MPTKKKNPLMLSSKEREIIDRAGIGISVAKNNLAQEEARLRQALELVGDRYDVDLTSGDYQINAAGHILPVNGSMGESSSSKAQLLKG